MNKTIKRLFLTFVSVFLVSVSVFSSFATTIYEYYGFKFTLINNFSVSIYSWDDSSSELIIPDKIEDRNTTEIRNRAFMGDETITSVDLSKTNKLEYIGMYAFKDCVNLTGNVTIPKCVNTLGNLAFEGCTRLESVDIKGNITSVPNQCFKDCVSLNSVTLSDSIESIGNYSFANCSSLTSLTLPKNVKSIANSAFQNVEGLKLYCSNLYTCEYAESHNIPYEIYNPTMGDSNGDGDVDIMDATYIQKYKIGAQGYDLTEYQRRCADVNRDGNVTVRDATLIQMKLAKYDVDF